MILRKMFKNRRRETINYENISNKEESSVSVPIRDIKQHLVSEFERTKQLELILESRNVRIEALEEIEIEYTGSLVLLDQYKERLDTQAETMTNLHSQIEKLKEARLQAVEKKNDALIAYNIHNEKLSEYKVRLEKNEQRFDSKLSDQVAKDVKEQMSIITSTIRRNIGNKVLNHKGNISKHKVIEIIDFEFNQQ